MKLLKSLTLLVALQFLSPLLTAQPIEENGWHSRSTVPQKIDVGGFELNFIVTDGELPAIVFESGGGLDSSAWRAVQELVRLNLRNAAVSYDRSGMGQSDLNPDKYSLDSEVQALNAGLDQLGYSANIIYVAHSYGAFLLDVYADLYPDSVNGAIYIEPNNIEYSDFTGGPDAVLESFDPSGMPDTDYGRAMSKQTLGFRAAYKRVSSIQAMPTPCLIVTAGVRWFPDEDQNNAWRQSHERIADRCGTELIVAEGDNHAVPFLSPHLVLDTILELLPSP